MENRVDLILRKYFNTFVAEEDDKIVEALNLGSSAIYQIERAIAQLKEPLQSPDDLRNTYKPTRLAAESVVHQLEAFLETTKPPNNSP